MELNNSTIRVNDGAREVVETFGGLNRALRIPEGEWSETINLSSDQYPMLSTRSRRTKRPEEFGEVIDMIDKAGLILLVRDNGHYLLKRVDGDVLLDLGDAAQTETATGLVSMGAYIIVLGTNAWYNTADGTHGTIDADYGPPTTDITGSSGYRPYALKLCPCDAEGDELRILGDAATTETAAQAEADPATYLVQDGDCIAYDSMRMIKKCHSSEALENASTWEIMPVLLRVEADGIDTCGVAVGDIVDISGIPTGLRTGVYAENWDIYGTDPASFQTKYNSRSSLYDEDPNGLHEVALVGDGFIVLKDVFCTRRITISDVAAQDVHLGRKMPEMDFVVEAQNRLWGCRYGEVDGEMINEIYASALGDFRNWRRYDGTSMASYAASVGTDGRWTGAISYNGNPIFFKAGCMHKVTISAYGAHQIRDYAVDGVRADCSKSLCAMNGRLYWVGRLGIYAYDGSLPAARISDKLGQYRVRDLTEVVAGGAGGKVFFGLYEGGAIPKLYCYDVRRMIWNTESTTVSESGATQYVAAITANEVGGLSAAFSDGTVWDLFGFGTRLKEDPVEWSCESGLIGYFVTEHQYISRFVLRVLLAKGAKMSVWVEYDSDGKWVHAGSLAGTSGKTASYVLPVRPRRCDHFRLRLSGTGETALYSFAKTFAKGSDVK